MIAFVFKPFRPRSAVLLTAFALLLIASSSYSADDRTLSRVSVSSSGEQPTDTSD